VRFAVRRRFALGGLIALACVQSSLAQSAPPLRTAASFALLGGSAVRSASPSTILGNVGVSPGSTISGISDTNVSVGRIARNDAAAREAQRDNAAAYLDLERHPCGVSLTSFGHTALPPRVYCFDGNAHLTGTLTLDANGDPDAVWIFLVRGALTTEARSNVGITGGGFDGNVFWQVAGSATLGEGSSFRGTILARTDITLRNGASLSGRALAQTGTVLLDGNDVSLCCSRITLSPESLAPVVAGVSYRQTLSASGGSGSYAFSTTGRPDWLSLDGNTLSGVPVRGTYTFTVTATDTLTRCRESRTYTLNVGCPLTLLPDTLPSGVTGRLYEATFEARGGSGSYVFTVTSTPHWDLSFTGTKLSGITNVSGNYKLTVTATDTVTGCSASRTYDVAVNCPAITIETASEIAAIAGQETCVPITVTGGSGMYAFEMSPPIAHVTENLLCVRPETAGDVTLTVKVTDTVTTCTGSRMILVRTPPCGTVEIVTETLPQGIVGTAYTPTIAATGGTTPYTFTTPGPLPPNVVLGSDGKFLNIPTTPGTYCFTVTVTDACGTADHRDYCVEVVCPVIVLTPLTLPAGRVGKPYDRTIVASGGSAPYTFTVNPQATQNGLTPSQIDTMTERISGTPLAAGTVTFTITATDAYGCTVTRSYSILTTPPAGDDSIPLLSPWAILILIICLGGAALVLLAKGGA